MWCAAACVEAELPNEPGETPGQIHGDMPQEMVVIFTPSLDYSSPKTPETKAIGDACKIDQLRAGIYQITSKGLVFIEIVTEPWSKVQEEGLSLKLSTTKAYKVLFWAEDKDNTAYRITESGFVQTDYSDYLSSGFSRMEELDAFCATSDVIPGLSETAQKVVLKRPFTQLNFADRKNPEEGYTARVTFAGMPVSYSPFTGNVQITDPDDPSDDITFRFEVFQKRCCR